MLLAHSLRPILPSISSISASTYRVQTLTIVYLRISQGKTYLRVVNPVPVPLVARLKRLIVAGVRSEREGQCHLTINSALQLPRVLVIFFDIVAVVVAVHLDGKVCLHTS